MDVAPTHARWTSTVPPSRRGKTRLHARGTVGRGGALTSSREAVSDPIPRSRAGLTRRRPIAQGSSECERTVRGKDRNYRQPILKEHFANWQSNLIALEWDGDLSKQGQDFSEAVQERPSRPGRHHKRFSTSANSNLTEFTCLLAEIKDLVVCSLRLYESRRRLAGTGRVDRTAVLNLNGASVTDAGLVSLKDMTKLELTLTGPPKRTDPQGMPSAGYPTSSTSWSTTGT